VECSFGIPVAHASSFALVAVSVTIKRRDFNVDMSLPF
jgi:hypothetical protein